MMPSWLSSSNSRPPSWPAWCLRSALPGFLSCLQNAQLAHALYPQPAAHAQALPQSDNLTRLVLSPVGTLPSLTSLDLSECALSYLFLQSATLRNLNLSHDSRLAKAIIQCGALDDLAMRGCISLISLLLWSDKLAKIDLRDSLVILQPKLHMCAVEQPCHNMYGRLKFST